MHLKKKQNSTVFGSGTDYGFWHLLGTSNTNFKNKKDHGLNCEEVS